MQRAHAHPSPSYTHTNTHTESVNSNILFFLTGLTWQLLSVAW